MRRLLISGILLMALAVGGLPLEAAPARHPSPQRETPLGTNLAGVVDWTTQQPFVDVFKTARPWISQREGAAWGEGGPLALTPEGWVASLEAGQYAETLMYTSDPAYPAGEYILLYKGEGTLVFNNGGVEILSEAAGRMVVNVTQTSGALFLQLRATNPADPLRDIRFIMPGHESTYESAPFNPLFLEKTRPFRALRFMDWMNTNDSPAISAAARPLPSDATYMARGVPVEVMVQLANTLQADAWFNMPHQADESYVRELATVVRDQLDPDLKAYIEYSNETWNSQFAQFHYAIEQGQALNLGEGDTFLGSLRFHSQRAVEFFAIWEDVFGGSERLVRVLAAQAANVWTGEQIITWQNAFEHADAIAIAPYFSCDDAGNPATVDTIAALSVDELLDRQMANVQEGGCAVQWMRDYAALAGQYGLELVAYEGGQHLVGYGGAENNEALTALFVEANRHPRMGEIYRTYLQAWFDAGGGLFMHFSDIGEPGKFGSWGALEYLTQDSSPKYEALMEFSGARTGG